MQQKLEMHICDNTVNALRTSAETWRNRCWSSLVLVMNIVVNLNMMNKFRRNFNHFRSKHIKNVDWKMPSKWTRWRLKSPASLLFIQPFIQAQIKENIRAPRHWPVNSPHKGPVTQKMLPFHDVIMYFQTMLLVPRCFPLNLSNAAKWCVQYTVKWITVIARTWN